MTSSASTMGRTEEDAAEVSSMVVTTGQVSMTVPTTPAATGGAVPKEAVSQEGRRRLGSA
jgi:hypothetical protein